MIPATWIEDDLANSQGELAIREGGGAWTVFGVGAYEYWEPNLHIRAGDYYYSDRPVHSLPLWIREEARTLGSAVPDLDLITSDALPPIPVPTFSGIRGRAIVIPGVRDKAFFFQTYTYGSFPANPFHPEKPLVVFNGGEGAAKALQAGAFGADLGDMFNPSKAFRRGINNLLDPISYAKDIFTGKIPVVWIPLPFGEGFIWIPIPNPFYFIFGPETDIERQKEAVKQLLTPVWPLLAEQGYEALDGKKPDNMDSDDVARRLCDNPAHESLIPEMWQDVDKIIDLAIGENKFSDGFRQRVMYQFLANCIKDGLTAEQTVQAWRALARSASPIGIKDLRKLGLGNTPYPLTASTPKPPCWQGPFPGDWQGVPPGEQSELPVPRTQIMWPPGVQVRDIPPRTQPEIEPGEQDPSPEPGPQPEIPPGTQPPSPLPGLQRPLWYPLQWPFPLPWEQVGPRDARTQALLPCNPCDDIDELKRRIEECCKEADPADIPGPRNIPLARPMDA